MAQIISVMGVSGSGKSTSILPNPEFNIKGLEPKETFIINVAGKILPARGSNKLYPLNEKISEGGRHLVSSNPSQISTAIKYISENRSDIKNIVIDDAGYIMGFDAMNNAKVRGYDKWVDTAVNFMTVINTAKDSRTDLKVFFLFHTEVGKDDKLKIKTSGSMIDNNIYLDGLFTINLEAAVYKDGEETKFGFMTKVDPGCTRKSPAGMFENDIIPNDLGYVSNQIDKYFNGE